MDEHYNLTRIKKKKAKYNVIYGQRSNGKTFAVLEEIVKNYFQTGKRGAYIRRFDEDFKRNRAKNLWNGLIENDILQKYNHNYTEIYYYSGCAYMAYRDEKGNLFHEDEPFCYYFALTSMEHDKSVNFDSITTICYDEFISRKFYLPDEFIVFMNVLSTIIRNRTDVTIYMLGNTINKYCIYFKEMGLTHILNMKRGDIEVYEYGVSGLTVAVEYAENFDGNENSHVYFAFDNPKLQMITKGEWELDIYPHCPIKYLPKEIIFNYFIDFNDELLHAEIINHEGNIFTFIHVKTTPIKEIDKDLVFCPHHSYKRNYRRNLLRTYDQLGKFIYSQFYADKVFYQDNSIGNLVDNYIKWCRTEKV